MTEEQAARFAQFIKDHDKRFEAKARPNGEESFVLLTSAADGTAAEQVHTVAEYEEAQIAGSDPGPTVVAAWEKWRGRHQGEINAG